MTHSLTSLTISLNVVDDISLFAVALVSLKQRRICLLMVNTQSWLATWFALSICALLESSSLGGLETNAESVSATGFEIGSVGETKLPRLLLLELLKMAGARPPFIFGDRRAGSAPEEGEGRVR